MFTSCHQVSKDAVYHLFAEEFGGEGTVFLTFGHNDPSVYLPEAEQVMSVE